MSVAQAIAQAKASRSGASKTRPSTATGISLNRPGRMVKRGTHSGATIEHRGSPIIRTAHTPRVGDDLPSKAAPPVKESVKYIQRAGSTKTAGPAPAPATHRGPTERRIKGNRPDGRYERRYIGENLKHPKMAEAKAAAAKSGENVYVTKGKRPMVNNRLERPLEISKTEPQGGHYRVEPSGKVHEILPKVVRIEPSAPQGNSRAGTILQRRLEDRGHKPQPVSVSGVRKSSGMTRQSARQAASQVATERALRKRGYTPQEIQNYTHDGVVSNPESRAALNAPGARKLRALRKVRAKRGNPQVPASFSI